jgi:hypothetical protein
VVNEDLAAEDSNPGGLSRHGRKAGGEQGEDEGEFTHV